MSGFYTGEDGARWVRFGPWSAPRNAHQDKLRSDWIHAAKASDTPWHETTKDGTYQLDVKLCDGLLAQPLFAPTDTKRPVAAEA